MTYIGNSDDWAECECGWTASGAWALDEARVHGVFNADHEMRCGATLSAVAPTTVGSGCHTCDAVAYLHHWLSLEGKSRAAWDALGDDVDDLPAEFDFDLRPPAPLPWLGAVADWEVTDDLMSTVRHLRCAKHEVASGEAAE